MQVVNGEELNGTVAQVCDFYNQLSPEEFLTTCQGLEANECPADSSKTTFHLPYDAVFYLFHHPAEEENMCPVMDCFCTCLVSVTYTIAMR